MKIKERYTINKNAKTGEKITCPSCGTVFVKKSYQQVFCKSKTGTKCKDKYWNTVTPGKRNNTTRISPANEAYMERNGIGIYHEDNFDDDQSWDAHKSY